MKLTQTGSVKDVYILLSEKSENVFHEETEPARAEGGGVCVCVQPLLHRADQGVDERDGEQSEIKDCDIETDD